MPSRAKRLESAISYCLIAAIFVIAVGIFLRQHNADMSRFGMDKTAAELLAQKKEEKTPLGLLTPSGFQVFSGIETYTTENLYEKINGKADFYLDSGFKGLSTRRFISKDDDSMWFELYVYDMAATRNAFSVFSVQRRPDAVISGTLDPQYAYRADNAMYCVTGHYYIELIGSAESNELFKAIVETRNKLAKELAVDMVTEITELRFFPKENLVPQSIRLYLADTFAFEGLTDTFTAKYKAGDDTQTAFFSRRPDSPSALTLAESYFDFLIDNGGSAKTATNETLKDLKARVLNFYGTTEIIFAAGPFVAGIHEAQNQQSAEKLAEILANKLNEVMNSAK